MSKNKELYAYANYTKPFSEQYGKKLRLLLGKPELRDCAQCVGYMLEAGVRHEQEAMLT